ncbi:CD63 antigen-like [Arapaima gigas]
MEHKATMALQAGTKCIKYLLILFCFLFWLCGVGLILLGALVQVTMQNAVKIQSISAAPIILIVAGVIIFFIAFFGCCGSWRENRCLIITFVVLLSFIIVAEIGAAITGYVFRGKVNEKLVDGLQDMISQYNSSTYGFRKAVDKMQEYLKCCGANSSSDWANYTLDHQSVPDSCCKNLTSHCGIDAIYDDSKIYQKGCLSALKALLKKNVVVVVCVVLLTALTQLIGAVYACVLIRGLRRAYEVL